MTGHPPSPAPSSDSITPLRCPVCGAAGPRAFLPASSRTRLTSEDVKITDRRFGQTLSLVECPACAFVFADGASDEELARLYSELVDEEYEAGADARRRQMARVLDGLASYGGTPASLLDIGAGTGLLVEAARARGIAAEGVEPSGWAVSRAEARGLALHHGSYPHDALAGRRFDAITAIDVVEHVADPMPLLEAIGHALQPGGIAVVATPDVHSLAARVFGRRWWHYRLAHVCFFNVRSMSTALDRVGLRLIGRERQRWWFPIDYLMQRLQVYVPPVALLRPLARPGRLLDRVVPLNLHDSWVYFALRQR